MTVFGIKKESEAAGAKELPEGLFGARFEADEPERRLDGCARPDYEVTVGGARPRYFVAYECHTQSFNDEVSPGGYVALYNRSLMFIGGTYQIAGLPPEVSDTLLFLSGTLLGGVAAAVAVNLGKSEATATIPAATPSMARNIGVCARAASWAKWPTTRPR